MQLKPRLKNIQKLDIQTGKLEIGKPLLFIYIYKDVEFRRKKIPCKFYFKASWVFFNFFAQR